MTRLVVVHDVLGTLFNLDAPIEELRSIFANHFKQTGSNPEFSELIIMDWYHSAKRDFATLSINDDYQPMANVFKSTLPRVLLQAGLSLPSDDNKEIDSKTTTSKIVAGNDNPFPDSVTERIMASLQRLQPRPGMVNAFTKTYRDENLVPKSIDQVILYGATNGGMALGEKLFKGALGNQVKIFTGQGAISNQIKTSSSSSTKGSGIGLFSCDEIKIAKPDPRVYQTILQRIQEENKDSSNTLIWFVASHTWDLFAAKKVGFRTAWVGYEEFYTCPDIYLKPDIIAKDLDEAAHMILEWEGQQH